MAATQEILVPYKFSPRPYQLPILTALDRGCKRAIWVCHRRAGKDLTIWNYLIKSLWAKPQIGYYIFPTYSQAKKVIWDGMTKDGQRFIDYIPEHIVKQKNGSELKIRFTNDSLLQLVGSDDIDKIVGTNPSICIFSEFALQRPDAWSYLRPILAENDGTAIFISTPRGKNHFYDLMEMAKGNPEWFVEVLGVDDTKAISKEAIDREVADGMSPDMVAQEFYCSFELGVEGSYYAKYLQEAKDEERITSVPWDRTKRVHTAWDIGFNDSTTIIFFQVHGQIINVIDFYENNTKGLDFYAKVLTDKKYLYDKHYLPHDGDHHDAATGMTYRSKGRELGLSFTVLPISPLDQGIEVVRGKFPRVWIDNKKCEYLLKCLENYRKAYDDRNRVYKHRPVHDWSSHACDAFRMMCIAVQNHFDMPQGPTDAEVERMYDRFQPHFP
jgi:phage terminase large subunit